MQHKITFLFLATGAVAMTAVGIRGRVVEAQASSALAAEKVISMDATIRTT